MLFGWRVAKHVNQCHRFMRAPTGPWVLGRQMSRVTPAGSRLWKAGEAGCRCQGSAVCSDASFRSRTGLIAAAKRRYGGDSAEFGARCRGGPAADEHGVAMAFTGVSTLGTDA